MGQNQWAYDLETLIYSIVKSRTESKLKEKYPKTKFTQDEEETTAPSFPTILIQSLEPIEKNKDLETEKINTILFTTQVTVTTNTSRRDAKYIADSLTDEYKKMLFDITTMPFVRKNGGVYTATFRARRSFDWNDVL